jgi:adenylosuccinate lyase
MGCNQYSIFQCKMILSYTKKIQENIVMIPRYSRSEMTEIWSEKSKFQIWFEIEAHACDAQAELGVIPKEAAKIIWQKGSFDIDRINEIERETKHDVIAFLTNLAEYVGPEARFVHQGMTSSDVLDTTLSVQLTRSADLLLADIDKVLSALKTRAFEHKYTPTIGRSHGIHAEPTTFGIKLARFYAEFERNKTRLKAAKTEIATCAISGAVGTFAHINPSVEAYVAEKMGLQIEPVSSQVIPRDRHAMFFCVLGVISSSIENLAIEIRHLQRTEVREAEEFFSAGQKGSSAMPHKRNPVLTENLTGLARIVRSSVIPALENVALWHERDISHSSVERMIAPDATVTLDFALTRLASVVEKLVIYPEQMQANLDALGGLVHSQQILLALTQKGVSREDSYRLVQKHAMEVWKTGGSYLEKMKSDSEVSSYLSTSELEGLFDTEQHNRHVDTIFERVFEA